VLIYQYDKDGVFQSSMAARPCPALPVDALGNERIILPARCATNAPPTVPMGSVAKAVSVTQESDQRREVVWELFEDHRGEVLYSTADKAQMTVAELGPLPAGYTSLVPPAGQYNWGGDAWEPDIPATIEAAKAKVDQTAELKRQTVLDASVGMQAAYQRKETEARAYLLDPAPIEAHYPYLMAEVGITAPTMKELADIIVAKANAWWLYGSAIETARLTAKKALTSATTTGEIEALVAAVAWPAAPE
jgi:hypothetical protein